MSILAKIVLPFLFFCSGSNFLHAQSVVLHGRVRDARTNEAIPSVNVRILGTSRGTVTNTEGSYTLSLSPGSITVVYSYLGYQSDTAQIPLNSDTLVNVSLVLSPLIMPEVVVSSEDPAVEIIRKAIAHKHEWLDRLQSYRFEAFTRQTIRRDSGIASISEAYTTGFQTVGDTMREIIRQKRQTENVPLDENFAAVRRIVNFNDDVINLFSVQANSSRSGYRFIGPTAPNALDNYDYKLLNTSTANGVEVYKIRMTPKSRLKPLFDGTITIADRAFAVMGVDLRPNEAFTIPFVSDIDINYRQQFALYDSMFWMPTNIRISGGLTLSLIGITIPRFGIELSSSIYDYSINAPVPDSIRAKQSLTVDSAATKYDSLFWKSHEVLPLTAEEQTAYESLDSNQTLDKQFAPKGPLMSFGDNNSNSFFENIDVRYNRVEGFFFGGKFNRKTLGGRLDLSGAAGYGFSVKDDNFRLGATLYSASDKKFGVGGEVYRNTDHISDQDYYGPFAISLMALIDQNDYRDYFLANGWKAFLTAQPSKTLSARAGFVDERHSSMNVNSTYTLFGGSGSFRPNPQIANGMLRAATFDLRYGDGDDILDLIPRNSLDVSIESSSPSFGSSDFKYTRYEGQLTLFLPTMAQDFLFSPMLRMRLSAGTGSGVLPPQRMFVVDSRASGYAPFGVLKAGGLKEFAGDKFVMLNLEHNFRSLPFLALNIPWLYRNSIELVLSGSAAQTWLGTQSTSGGWYCEAGAGFSRILGLLRFDVSYRFADPRRFFFTFSAAQLL